MRQSPRIPGDQDPGPASAASPQNGARQAAPSQRKSKRRRSGRRAAVIDLGTNNCRLLIAEQTRPGQGHQLGSGFRVVDSYSKIVRLGEGLGQTGDLSPAAIDRTLAALKICAKKIERSGARQIRAVATEACRQASNGGDFLAQVEAETGIRLKTISAMQEVQLGVASTMPLLRRRWPYALIFDVGGGSTEVSFLQFKQGRGFQLQDSLSVPMGVVSLAEAGSQDRQADLAPAAYHDMRARVAEAFADFAEQNQIRALQGERQVQTVGMSGTVTTVKALDLGLTVYRRNQVDRTLFHMGNLTNIRDQLFATGQAGIAANSCIGQDRADLVLPGIAILEGLGEVFGFMRLLVLDRGLREGLLHEIFSRPPPRRRRGNGPGKSETPKEVAA